MKTFEFLVTVAIRKYIAITAENEEQARDEVRDQFSALDDEYADVTTKMHKIN